MCACRLEASPSHTAPPQAGLSDHLQDLEEYYSPYLSDMDHRIDCSSSDPEDLYSQLAQKERDLILAAELGKALLDKNEELSKKHEAYVEENNQKLEELTQEKHELRLRLEAVEQEYEVTVRELQQDVASLRHELEATEDQARTMEKNKAQVIHELTLQNERLTEQLQKSGQCEEELQTQVAGMREQVHARRSSMHAHVQQLAVLRDEIQFLNEKRAELERRMSQVMEEKDQCRSNLEDAQDRIMMLEKTKFEHEHKIRIQEREISELQEQTVHLQDKIESLSLQASSSVFTQSSNSLYNELEMSKDFPHSMSTDSLDNALGAELDSPKSKSGTGATRPNKLLLPTITFPTPPLCEDDIECDDDVAMTASLSPESLSDMQYLAGFRSPEDPDHTQLKQEVVEAYAEVQQMVSVLKGKEGLEGEAGRAQSKQLSPTEPSGSLIALLQELRQLMQTIVRKQISETPPVSPPEINEHSHDDLEIKVKELREELESTQEHLSRVRADMDLKDNELRQKSSELKTLTNKLSLQHQELQALQAERDKLQDRAAGITRDDILDQARSERNEALQKRNSMEVELAQAKLDLMSLDAQLMEAIQQKVALSQQLEQWQDDMAELINVQMTKRIKSEDIVEETLSNKSSPAIARRKRHPFWS